MTRPSGSRPNLSLRSSLAPAKEPAHLPLHRQLLFPTHPPDKALPVLVPGEGAEISLLNERIYHLIALSFRAYILSWLPRITRDRSLLPHIHQSLLLPILLPIFASLSSEPERLIPFLLYDLPSLLTLHWKTYWQARTTLHVLHAHGGVGEMNLDEAYHSHLPLLSTEPAPRDFRAAPQAKGSTETSVKTERGNQAENEQAAEEQGGDSDEGEQARTVPEGQYIVSGLWLTALVDTIIKQSLPKEKYAVNVQRTMMRELIGRTILGSVAKRIGEDWFWWSLLLKFLPTSTPGEGSTKGTGSPGLGILDQICGVFDLVLRGLMKVWATGIWVMTIYTSASEVTYTQTTRCWLELLREVLNVDGRAGRRNWPLRILWGMAEVFFFLLSPLFDRILPYLIRLYLLTPTTALRLVDLLEKIMYPLDGYPAPAPPDPTVEEAIAMRREIEERLSMLLPKHVRTIFAPDHLDLQALLDPVSHPGCNAHLVGMIYASAFATVIPGLVVGNNG